MAPRASWLVAAAMAVLAISPVRAGSSRVADADGSQWVVIEDPADGAQGYVLRRLRPDGKPDPRFGSDGQRPVSISATNDAPTSVRVDAGGRVWLAGASISADQPQAVIERLLPDGSLDLRWGVQGRVQLSPGGIAIKPNDLLPLSDGSVLVAGVAANLDPNRAIVFHLKADGALDTTFGSGGTWQRAGSGDASTATGLAVDGNGSVAVSVAAPGASGVAEIWSFDERPAKLVARRALEASSDGEDVRVTSSGERWMFAAAGGPTTPVGAAFLGAHPAPLRPPSGAAASDPGLAGFSPFSPEAASAETSRREADEGLPWAWLGLATIGAAAAIGLAVMRGRAARKGELEPGGGSQA